MNKSKTRIDGWTIAYIVMALVFLVVSDFSQAGMVAGIFWGTLAAGNEFFARF